MNERFAVSRSLGPYHGSKVNVFTLGSLVRDRLLGGKLIFHSCPPTDHRKVSKKYTRWGIDRALADFIALGTRVLTGGTNISSSCSRAFVLAAGYRDDLIAWRKLSGLVSRELFKFDRHELAPGVNSI